MSATTAKLAARKLTEECGITDDRARAMFDRLGSTHMAIVELRATERTEDTGDAQTVKLQLIHLELADADTADHLRDLARALYVGRTPIQLDIDSIDDVEPDADEIIRRGRNTLTALQTDDADTDDDLVPAP